VLLQFRRLKLLLFVEFRRLCYRIAFDWLGHRLRDRFLKRACRRIYRGCDHWFLFLSCSRYLLLGLRLRSFLGCRCTVDVLEHAIVGVKCALWFKISRFRGCCGFCFELGLLFVDCWLFGLIGLLLLLSLRRFLLINARCCWLRSLLLLLGLLLLLFR